MSISAEEFTRGTTSDMVVAQAPASEAPSIVGFAKQMLRLMVGTMASTAAPTSKQNAVDQKTDERRRAAEVKQKESDNRFTSPELIRAIEDSFGPIDFDPCWHEASAVRPGAYLDVRQGHNGLRDEWAGPLAFVNPPWSSQDKWVKRGHNQWAKGNATTVLCLVPAKTDTKFFHAVLATKADVYFLEGRPHFFKGNYIRDVVGGIFCTGRLK